MSQLEVDPFSDGLTTRKAHYVQDHQKYFATNVTKDYRIIWDYLPKKDSEKKRGIKIIDIGTHNGSNRVYLTKS